eukprot:TRINITY_DN114030_c0_g1_i1.p1 TRINITY_DN114030_c0_g1~~TRINITY_DN114030_c0_g1_i1.p1  ORF type:complete len:1053 (+),score=104.36 TRINITY_DN114030_c0_g1_i1:37-3195(+)
MKLIFLCPLLVYVACISVHEEDWALNEVLEHLDSWRSGNDDLFDREIQRLREAAQPGQDIAEFSKKAKAFTQGYRGYRQYSAKNSFGFRADTLFAAIETWVDRYVSRRDPLVDDFAIDPNQISAEAQRRIDDVIDAEEYLRVKFRQATAVKTEYVLHEQVDMKLTDEVKKQIREALFLEVKMSRKEGFTHEMCDNHFYCEETGRFVSSCCTECGVHISQKGCKCVEPPLTPLMAIHEQAHLSTYSQLLQWAFPDGEGLPQCGVTFLAPSDAAFARWGKSAVDQLYHDVPLLQEFLLLTIIPEVFNPATLEVDLFMKKVASQLANYHQSLKFFQKDGKTCVGGPMFDVYTHRNVATLDTATAFNVAHTTVVTIDAVLTPAICPSEAFEDPNAICAPMQLCNTNDDCPSHERCGPSPHTIEPNCPCWYGGDCACLRTCQPPTDLLDCGPDNWNKIGRRCHYKSGFLYSGYQWNVDTTPSLPSRRAAFFYDDTSVGIDMVQGKIVDYHSTDRCGLRVLTEDGQVWSRAPLRQGVNLGGMNNPDFRALDDDDDGLMMVHILNDVVQLETSTADCASIMLKSDGTVVVWEGWRGSQGDDDDWLPEEARVTDRLPNGMQFIDVAIIGEQSYAALSSDHQVWMWGKQRNSLAANDLDEDPENYGIDGCVFGVNSYGTNQDATIPFVNTFFDELDTKIMDIGGFATEDNVGNIQRQHMGWAITEDGTLYAWGSPQGPYRYLLPYTEDLDAGTRGPFTVNLGDDGHYSSECTPKQILLTDSVLTVSASNQSAVILTTDGRLFVSGSGPTTPRGNLPASVDWDDYEFNDRAMQNVGEVRLHSRVIDVKQSFMGGAALLDNGEMLSWGRFLPYYSPAGASGGPNAAFTPEATQFHPPSVSGMIATATAHGVHDRSRSTAPESSAHALVVGGCPMYKSPDDCNVHSGCMWTLADRGGRCEKSLIAANGIGHIGVKVDTCHPAWVTWTNGRPITQSDGTPVFVQCTRTAQECPTWSWVPPEAGAGAFPGWYPWWSVCDVMWNARRWSEGTVYIDSDGWDFTDPNP